jgi:hypothetical protein
VPHRAYYPYYCWLTPAAADRVTDLPVEPVLGAEFVPAFTLARRMPSGVGIALDPGAEASVPIYPEGVGYLAATLGPRC